MWVWDWNVCLGSETDGLDIVGFGKGSPSFDACEMEGREISINVELQLTVKYLSSGMTQCYCPWKSIN